MCPVTVLICYKGSENHEKREKYIFKKIVIKINEKVDKNLTNETDELFYWYKVSF